LLVDEPGSDLANEAYDSHQSAATVALAHVEARAALARMRKGRRLSVGRYRTALDDLDDLWSELEIHAVTDGLIEAASRTATNHALRAYDSLHLATITTFANVESVAVVCWDRELREAASVHGFTLIPRQLD
jgi:uncharacterized protein